MKKWRYEVDGILEWYWEPGDVSLLGISKEWYEIRDADLKNTPNKQVIVQAGGSCGLYPRLWAKYFQTVHTFEPVDGNFEVLCMNCPSESIHKHHAALGDSNDRVLMKGGFESKDGRTYYNIEITPENCYRNAGMYWVEEKNEAGAYQMRLDQLELERVDAIQLDVEKYEIHVLRGAIETIKRCSPTLCVENCNEEVMDFLAGLGYEKVDQAWEDSILIRRK